MHVTNNFYGSTMSLSKLLAQNTLRLRIGKTILYMKHTER